MEEYFLEFGEIFWATLKDVAPIVVLIAFFQIVVLRNKIPNFKKVLLGVVFVIIGLTLFLIGLEKALFPLGNIMASQLSDIEFIKGANEGEISWKSYYWIYIFASLIGFSTTIAEPSLIAVAIKAHEVSGGTVSKRGLRLVVALGVAIALVLGTIRIVIGAPLYLYILIGYVIVVLLTIITPKSLIPLAYDLGGVTTSTVTVPVVAAIGIGLAVNVPGRNPALDGFGLIAFASLFPIVTVLIYIQVMELLKKYNKRVKDEV